MIDKIGQLCLPIKLTNTKWGVMQKSADFVGW